MPGSTPSAAVTAFVDPLKKAISCLGTAHLTLSKGARSKVGDTHSWDLNEGRGLTFKGGCRFMATMHFEILDQGASARDRRYRVSTKGYMYGLRDAENREFVAAHWHPHSRSDYVDPHWHFGAPALSPNGVWLERAHIPSPRISLEEMIRWTFQTLPFVEPAREDWETILDRTETDFREHKSW